MRSSDVPNRHSYADRHNPIAYVANLLPFIIIIITINIFGRPFSPHILTYLAKTEWLDLNLDAGTAYAQS